MQLDAGSLKKGIAWRGRHMIKEEVGSWKSKYTLEVEAGFWSVGKEVCSWRRSEVDGGRGNMVELEAAS